MKKILTILFVVLLIFSSKAQINVYLTIEPPTGATNCDGWVMAYVQTGQSPYTYVWNDTLTTSGDPFLLEYDTLWNLCPGVYTLDIYDSAGDSLHLDFFLTSNDMTFGSGTGAGDTIEYSVEDCSIDYSIPVDTAYLSSAVILNVFPGASADSIAVDWVIIQSTDTTLVSDTIIGYFPVGSDFILNAGVFCPDSAFKTQVKVIQIFGLIDQNVGIINLENHSIKVFPNPCIDVLQLRGLGDNESVIIKVYDIQGKLVFQEFVNGSAREILLNDIKKGMYILEFYTPSQVYSKKIIKQ